MSDPTNQARTISDTPIEPMTETEWLACDDPTTLVVHLQGIVSDRKFRLFACACVRRFWHLLSDARSPEAIEASERFADDPRSILDLLGAERAAEEAANLAHATYLRADADYEIHFLDDAPDGGSDPSGEEGYHAYAAFAAASDAMLAAQLAQRVAAYRLNTSALLQLLGGARRLAVARYRHGQADELSAQCQLLREVIACPFRRVRVDPAWLCWEGGVVWDLAWGVYEDGAFDRLPILGDALEEAGCADQALLDHCRAAGPHSKGCWAVDLLLGKA